MKLAQKTIRMPQICPKCGGEVNFRQEMVTFPGPLKTTIYCRDCEWKEEYDDVDSVIVGDAVIDMDGGMKLARKPDCYFYAETNVGPMSAPICTYGGCQSNMHLSCEKCDLYIDKGEVTEFVLALLRFRNRRKRDDVMDKLQTMEGIKERARMAGEAIKDIFGKVKGNKPEERCEQCAHYHSEDEYDWCHECMMECDHFKAKE